MQKKIWHMEISTKTLLKQNQILARFWENEPVLMIKTALASQLYVCSSSVYLK